VATLAEIKLGAPDVADVKICILLCHHQSKVDGLKMMKNMVLIGRLQKHWRR